MDFTSYENKIPQIFLTGLISAFDTLSVWAKFAVARRVIIDFFWGPVYGRGVQKVCSEKPRLHDCGLDSKVRDFLVQGFHPALQSKFRGRLGKMVLVHAPVR